MNTCLTTPIYNLDFTIYHSPFSLPATGLTHLGRGRYYAPALGRPLQPNSVGGVPLVPQALNRYAATSLGQVGVAQAEMGNAFNWTAHTIGFAKNLSVELAGTIPVVTGYRFTGKAIIEATASQSALARRIPKSLRQSFDQATFAFADDGRKFYTRRGIFSLSGDSLSGLESRADDIVTGLQNALPSRKPWAATISKRLNIAEPTPVYGQLDDLAHLRKLRTGVGLGLDFVIGAGFQYWDDAKNPYLTWEQRIIRTGVSGSGSAFFGAIGGLVGLLCGPGAFICVPAGGTIGGLLWVPLQPVVFDLIPVDINPQRKLLPLQ